ncbi:MAG UNVERIFIED_CONTAM: homoserine dehydrogenase [Planctomycetaceae bacterium]
MAVTAPLHVALVGCGTVGSGVVRILQSSRELLARQTGRTLELSRIVVRDTARARSVDLSGIPVTDRIEDVLEDSRLGVVIHVVGGLEPARTDILRLLRAGRDVITANKALLYEHGDELFAAASEAGRTISFEAAVAGGIPIISTVSTALTGNRILSIEAILNGTSNFILSRMLDQRQTYEDVLQEAQRRGYAEADPAMDVDGIDAAQKLAILVRLAFGTPIRLEDLVLQGIRRIELLDLLMAAELGYRIELLAAARMAAGRLEVSVQPTLVRRDRSVGMTSGADNFVAIEGDAVGVLRLAGAGAGQLPTASAVVADLVDVATGRAAITFQALLRMPRSAATHTATTRRTDSQTLPAFRCGRPSRVLADIAHILGRHGISISSVRQDETEDVADESGVARLVIITHRASEGRLRAADDEIGTLDSLRGERIRMPIAE